MKTVFCVVGSQGEYSDQSWWIVAAYPEKEAADQHTALLNEVVKKGEWRSNKEFNPPLDPKGNASWRWDVDSLEYATEEIPFFLHVDQLLEQTPE